MRNHSAPNERIKRQYFTYLKEAKRQNEATVDAVAHALARFEAFGQYRDFKTFHHQQAVNFKQRLAEQNSKATGAKLSKATLHATLSHLKRFFQWLAWQPGYRSKFQYSAPITSTCRTRMRGSRRRAGRARCRPWSRCGMSSRRCQRSRTSSKVGGPSASVWPGRIMFFKQPSAKDSSLSYFFGCAGHGKAVAVDVVAGDEHWFLAEAERAGVALTHGIDTHVHADHYSGGPQLARILGAPYCLHESVLASTTIPFEPLRDEQVLNIGNTKIRVLHTPGHTAESVCLLVTDMRRGDAPRFLISGDTLFVESVGRPDLAGREMEFAGLLYESLHPKLLELPDEIEIFPGHQAGSACGAGLSGKPSSTLGFEKRWNLALSLDKAAFIDQITKNIPPRPADMDAMTRFNLRLAY